MHRFFLPAGFIGPEQVHFPAEIAHQLVRVLRQRPGDRVLVLDNQGSEFLVELQNLDARSAAGRVIERRQASAEPQLRLTLFIGLTQREKFEWILQKGTELGVAEFAPVITSRSLVQDQQGLQPGGPKSRRWERIIQEAAEQSGRGRLPVLSPPARLADALSAGSRDYDLALIPWEGERKSDLQGTLRRTAAKDLSRGSALRLAALIGPEGGLAPEEVELGRKAGWIPVTLGPRILRMETAGVITAAIVFYEFGEMKFTG